MVFAQECQLRVGVNLYLEEDQKDVKLYQHSMVKLVSLKKSDHFKKYWAIKKYILIFIPYLQQKTL